MPSRLRAKLKLDSNRLLSFLSRRRRRRRASLFFSLSLSFVVIVKMVPIERD